MKVLSSGLVTSRSPAWLLRVVALNAAANGLFDSAAQLFELSRRKCPDGYLDARHEAHVRWLQGDTVGLNKLLEEMTNPTNIRSRQFPELQSWAFWTLDHRHWVKFLQAVRRTLDDHTSWNKSLGTRHCNSEFTSNQGHLALLSLRAAFLNKTAPDHELVVSGGNFSNDAYFRLIARRFANVRLVDEVTFSDEVEALGSSESLLFGRDADGAWQIQPAASQAFGASLIEMDYFKDYPFEAELEDRETRAILDRWGLLRENWFVVLHVRQPLKSVPQARDSDIEKARLLVNLVNSLGGVVVRMGDPSFPRFDADGCWDYAHSAERRPDIDVWLWSNARWWTGNPSGASATMFTFRPPRVLYDVWPWDGVGQCGDIWCPSLVRTEKEGVYLTPEEVVRSPIGRAMNPKHFDQHELELVQCSESEITEANHQMWHRTSTFWKHRQDGGMRFDALQERVGRSLSTWQTNLFMPIANASAEKYLSLAKLEGESL